MNDKVLNLNLVFSTPIWGFLVKDYTKLNINMLEYIKELQKSDPEGVNKSNVFGWHSKSFDMNNKKVSYFFESIKPNINNTLIDMGWDDLDNKINITSAWSIINKKNASNERHIHSNSYISAVYYVCAPNNCGDILFHDPRQAKVIRKPNTIKANKLNAEVVNITPQSGLLVLFPSYLYHSVAKNNSDEERIIISFNIDIK